MTSDTAAINSIFSGSLDNAAKFSAFLIKKMLFLQLSKFLLSSKFPLTIYSYSFAKNVSLSLQVLRWLLNLLTMNAISEIFPRALELNLSEALLLLIIPDILFMLKLFFSPLDGKVSITYLFPIILFPYTLLSLDSAVAFLDSSIETFRFLTSLRTFLLLPSSTDLALSYRSESRILLRKLFKSDIRY